MIKNIVNTLSVLLIEVHYVMNNVLPRDDIHTPLQHAPSPHNILRLLFFKFFSFANPCNHCKGNNTFHRPSPPMLP